MKSKLIIGTLLIVLDQFLKLFAVTFFQSVFNSGIAFGIGKNVPVSATIIVFFVLSALLLRGKFSFGETLLLAGGAGNILDRLIYGKVVDWIRFGNLWFNLADVYIGLGVLMITLVATSSKIKSQISKPS